MQRQVSFGRRGATPGPEATTAVAADAAGGPIATLDDRDFGRIPWASLIILTLLAAIFLVELANAPGQAKSINVPTLIHLGGVSRDLVLKDGQVWRLLTAPWLHSGTAHIVGNGVALVMFGVALEPVIGWRWLTAVYTLGGLAGSLASISLTDQSITSVGASGAIMALMGCAAAVSLHPAAYERRKYIWRMCLVSVVPALLPTSSHVDSATHVDYSAHTGGVVFGIIAGGFLVLSWNARRSRPPMQGAAMVVGLITGLVGLGALAAAATLPAAQLPNHGTPGLFPVSQAPASGEDSLRRASELVQDYPNDPRGHALMAVVWAKRGGDGAAELELQKALASPLLHAPEIPPTFERDVRTMLTGIQLKQHEYDAALLTAAPLCPMMSTLDPRLQTALKQIRACSAR